MTPERWAQIEAIFHRAAELDPDRRVTLLDEECHDDLELRREVEALLSFDGTASDHLRSALRSELRSLESTLTGKAVSHYRILDALGGGGMGVVYVAEDLRLGRRVAIKFLNQEAANDPAALARFEREARAASTLEHPNICPVYEFGEHRGQPFLVMQLLEGQTLQQIIRATNGKKPPLELATLLRVAIQVIRGLEAAHNRGIIHRDIKPANIFQTKQTETKILDFGLAKLVPFSIAGLQDGTEEASSETVSTTIDPFLSRTGGIMGTAGYMSPEQLRGEKLDARTDLFSFGLVLYEMATGKRAFTGDTWPALQEAISNQTPNRARKLNPTIPRAFEKIIRKALEKDRALRYQNAAELRADIEALQRQLEPRPLHVRWVAAVTAVITMSILGAMLWLRKSHPSSETSPDLKLRQLTANSGEIPVKTGAISPNGKYLAYTDIKGVHIKLLDSGETHLVPQPEEFRNRPVQWEIGSTAWFPDSTRFLANSHPGSEDPSAWSSQTSGIWLISVLGGAPYKLREKAVAWSVSPDAGAISFGTNLGKQGDREIWLMQPSGLQATKLFESDADGAICCLTFFPTGQRVAYVAVDKSGSPSLVARDLKGGPVATLLRESDIKKMGDGFLLSDGRLIYSDPCVGLLMRTDSPCNYWVMKLDINSGGMIQQPRRLSNWVGVWLNEPSATADGKRIAFLQSSGHGSGLLFDLKGERRTLVNSRIFPIEEGGEDAIGVWSSDSKSVFVLANRADHYSLYKQSLDYDAQQSIVAVAEGGLLENVQLTPDEKWVILQVWPISGGQDIRIERVPVTGGIPEPVISMREGSFCFCARAPSTVCALGEISDDGKRWIIKSFDVLTGRGPELARFDLDPKYDTNADKFLWSISPDGNRIAAISGPGAPIQIKSLTGDKTRIVRPKTLKHMQSIAWAHDGKGFVVSTSEKPKGKILYVDLEGNTQQLWECSSDWCFAGESPDGRHVAIYDWKHTANFWLMENF